MKQHRAKDTLVVNSRAMQDVLDSVLLLAKENGPVFIDGEAGTGRKLLSRVIHEEGPHGHVPPVSIRCDMLTVDAMDRILFGDMKTGVMGKLEAAGEGTLVFNDLEELNPVAQERLAGVITAGRYQTSAGDSRRLVCRLMATGNRRVIHEQRKLGRFSNELLSFFEQTVLHVPTLAERREDIPHLVTEVLSEMASRERIEVPSVPYHYMELLMTVAWPENVRQLRNHVESVMALSNGMFDPEIIREHFQPEESAATIKGALQTLWSKLRSTAANPALDHN